MRRRSSHNSLLLNAIAVLLAHLSPFFGGSTPPPSVNVTPAASNAWRNAISVAGIGAFLPFSKRSIVFALTAGVQMWCIKSSAKNPP
jgi:hypothetical protein